MTSELEKKIPDIKKTMKTQNALALEREGLKEGVVEPWEDSYRTRKDPGGSFEWWYFDMQFEGGWTAVVTFNTKSLTHPNHPLEPSLLMIMKTPDGKQKKMGPTFKPDELSGSADSCDVHLGPNHVKGDLAGYELHAEAEDCAVDVSITREAPSWRPGAGITYSGHNENQLFGWVVPVPYGTVEGSITFEGQKHEVKGTCYHDHNWGNVSPGMAFDHWYWGRAHVGEFSIIFVEMVTRHVLGLGQLKLHTFYLAKGQEIVTDDGLPLSLTTEDFKDGPGGRKYPTKLDFKWDGDEGTATLSLRNPELIEALDLLDGEPKWVKPLVHLIASPYYYDFNADLELTIDIKGVKATEKGRALYELMMLR